MSEQLAEDGRLPGPPYHGLLVPVRRDGELRGWVIDRSGDGSRVVLDAQAVPVGGTALGARIEELAAEAAEAGKEAGR